MLTFKTDQPMAKHCCLLTSSWFPVDTTSNFWNNSNFIPLRETNKKNIWDPACSNCEQLEKSNLESERTGMNHGLELSFQTELSGPARIDLTFDISCNLACRTCGAHSSTYWQKHLKENGLWDQPISVSRSKNEVIAALKQLDLSNLRMLVFCGGETLLGQEYWDVARWLGDNVPDAKHGLTLCFQTNGTQPIHPRNFEIIEKFHLVKLHISLDGAGEKFEYIRWPAKWSQVTENITSLKDTVPSNVMFLVEETISIFNLAYLQELESWVNNNFATNREGDIVNHTRHLANGMYSLGNCTQEYVDAIRQTPHTHLIPTDWSEDSAKISNMVANITRFDQFRNQSFSKVFPEVSEYYSRFL